MPHHSVRTFAAITVVALVTTACSSVAENLTERVVEEAAEAAADQGVEVDLDTEGGGITVETDEGTVSIGGDTDLPDGFPSSLPLPDDFAVAGSMSQSTEEGESLFVTLSTTADQDTLVQDIESGLTSAGWEITETSEVNSGGFNSTTWTVAGEGYEGTVAATFVGEGEGSQIIYILERATAS